MHIYHINQPILYVKNAGKITETITWAEIAQSEKKLGENINLGQKGNGVDIIPTTSRKY